jgi:hypothetical protein
MAPAAHKVPRLVQRVNPHLRMPTDDAAENKELALGVGL